MGQPNPLCLGDQSQQASVGVETPRASGCDELQTCLVISEKQLIARPAGGVLVGQLDGSGAVPLHVDNRDNAIGHDAAYRRSSGQLFKTSHTHPLPWVFSLGNLALMVCDHTPSAGYTGEFMIRLALAYILSDQTVPP